MLLSMVTSEKKKKALFNSKKLRKVAGRKFTSIGTLTGVKLIRAKLFKLFMYTSEMEAYRVI